MRFQNPTFPSGVMAALHRSPLAPTGCSHAISVRLCTEHDASSGSSSRGTVISHLVTARDSLLQVWEVREYGEAGAVSRAGARAR